MAQELMAQRWIDSLANKRPQFAASDFSCFTVSILLKILPNNKVPRPYGAVAAAAAIEITSCGH